MGMEVAFWLTILLLGGGGWYAHHKWTGKRDIRRKKKATWKANYYSKNNKTIVEVQRIFTDSAGNDYLLEKALVDTIPEDATDWELRLHQAMADARANAIARNAEMQ